MSNGGFVAIIAAAHAKAIQRVVDAFRLAGATAADRARSLTDLSLAEDAAVAELRKAGVIKPGAARDSWYLDEAAYIVRRDAGPKKAVIVVLVLISLLLLVAIVMVILTKPR
jgi:hypothetical protein